MDQVVPEPGTLPKAIEKEARTVDLVVLSHFNGKQRDIVDWNTVFSECDLELEAITRPKSSHFAILQLVREAGNLASDSALVHAEQAQGLEDGVKEANEVGNGQADDLEIGSQQPAPFSTGQTNGHASHEEPATSKLEDLVLGGPDGTATGVVPIAEASAGSAGIIKVLGEDLAVPTSILSGVPA